MAASKRTLWKQYYFDETCSTTFFNGKESAKKAKYNCSKDHNYAVIGSQNFRIFKEDINKWLDENGMSDAALKMKLVKLMGAKESKFMKIKGAITENDLPKGVKKIATSGVIEKDEDGETEYGTGETLLSIEVEAIETQRKTLDMGLKVKGMNAPEKHEHTGADGKELIPIINVTTTGNKC